MRYDADLFTPMKIMEVEEILLYDFDALKVSKIDERLKFHLNDPFCPDVRFIQGVYVIYKQSILQLLEGRFQSIDSYEFKESKRKEPTVHVCDMEYVLEMATVVVLASESDNVLTSCFYSGAAKKLDSIFNLCIGYSKELENKKYKHSLRRFLNDIKIVEQMGLLERLMKNKYIKNVKNESAG